MAQAKKTNTPKTAKKPANKDNGKSKDAKRFRIWFKLAKDKDYKLAPQKFESKEAAQNWNKFYMGWADVKVLVDGNTPNKEPEE